MGYYYDAALASFERTRACYLAAGQTAQWEELVADVRRKYGFMPGFERIVAARPN